MVTDHKGNEFPTKKAMYEHWKTTQGRVTNRLAKGFSLGEALEAKRISASDAGKRGRDASGWGRGNEIVLSKKSLI